MRRSTRARGMGASRRDHCSQNNEEATWKLSVSPVAATAATLILLGLGLPTAHCSPINRQVGISENVFITVQNDTYGNEQRVCSIDSVTYEDGDSIPTSSPCEHCICRPPGFACTIISCEYRPGCKALKRSNQCCPEYQCECEKDGKIYQNGEKILDNNNPCEVCYCQGGDVICAVIDCYWRSDCQPRYIENRCCPLYDHCPPPSHPGPMRPIQTLPTTTRRTTLASVFPWGNATAYTSTTTTTTTTTPTTTITTTTEASVTADLSTSSPAALSTADPVFVSSAVPSVPANENLIIPSQSQDQGIASSEQLSSEAPVQASSSAPISTEIPAISTEKSSTTQQSHIPDSDSTPPKSTENSINEGPENPPPESVQQVPSSTESSPDNVKVQDDNPINASQSIVPEPSTPEDAGSSSTGVAGDLVEPSVVKEIQPSVVGGPELPSSEYNVLDQQEATTEATLPVQGTGEIVSIEPTKVLETVEPSSSPAGAVDSSQSTPTINPLVTPTSASASAVEPTALPVTTPISPQIDDLTNQNEPGPVESQTELPPSADINTSAKPVEHIEQENAPQFADPVVATTVQSIPQDDVPSAISHEPLSVTQNNEISEPVEANNVPASSSAESKPLVQNDIIIDPVEAHNELPAILSQQKPLESAEKISHTAQESQEPDAPVSRPVVNESPVIPQSLPVASGNVIQLLPGPTDSPVVNLESTDAQPLAPLAVQDDSVSHGTADLVSDVVAQANQEATTIRIVSDQSSNLNVNEIDSSVYNDVVVATTTVPHVPVASPENHSALSDDTNPQPQEATTTKSAESPVNEVEPDPVDQQILLGDEILTPNTQEKATENYLNDAPSQQPVNSNISPEIIQTTAAYEKIESDEPATTQSAALSDQPAENTNQNSDTSALQDQPAEVTEVVQTIVSGESVKNSEITADNNKLSDGLGNNEEASKLVKENDEGVEQVTGKSNGNGEPVATTQSFLSTANDDVAANEDVNELTTTATSEISKEPVKDEVQVADEVGQTILQAADTQGSGSTGPNTAKITEQGATDAQHSEPSSETLKLRLDPSVFSGTSVELGGEQQSDDSVVATTVETGAISNDDDTVTTAASPVIISRQEVVSSGVATENDLVFDNSGPTNPPSIALYSESQPTTQSVSVDDSAITTSGPAALLNSEDLRSSVNFDAPVAASTESVVEATTIDILVGKERSDLESAEIASVEISTALPQLRTKSNETIETTSENEPAVTTEIQLADEKLDADLVQTTAEPTLLLRHHHPDHHGFHIEETTKIPQEQQQDDDTDGRGENDSNSFRTLEATTVANEPEADEPEATTINSKPDFRSDLDIDIITSSSQSSVLSTDEEPTNVAAATSDQVLQSDPSLEDVSNLVKEQVTTTANTALELDASTLPVRIVDDSTEAPDLSRSDSVPESAPTTAAGPTELQDGTEDETTAADLSDDAVTTTSASALDDAEDEIDAAAPTASAITLNRLPPEPVRKPTPIIDDLVDRGLARSDFSLQDQAKEEVTSADDTWFWRTVSRVRRLPQFFSALSRRPRSVSEKQELQKPTKIKKPTGMEPKKKLLIRPFLFW